MSGQLLIQRLFKITPIKIAFNISQMQPVAKVMYLICNWPDLCIIDVFAAPLPEQIRMYQIQKCAFLSCPAVRLQSETNTGDLDRIVVIVIEKNEVNKFFPSSKIDVIEVAKIF
jgi:hypothetical protein